MIRLIPVIVIVLGWWGVDALTGDVTLRAASQSVQVRHQDAVVVLLLPHLARHVVLQAIGHHVQLAVVHFDAGVELEVGVVLWKSSTILQILHF